MLFALTLFAHPHTFIDIYPTIKVSNDTIEEMHFKWKLDEMTSSMLIMQIDQNCDGKLDKKESNIAYKNYFLVFEDYSFYTYIKINQKIINFPKPKNFRASIENHKLCYSFDIDLHENIHSTVIEFGDSDFYFAFTLKPEFVSISGAQAIVTGVDNDFYYGYRLEMK